MKPERWRLFVAVPVADKVKAAIAELLERKDINREFKCPRAEKIHLTIRFFGNVPANQVPDLQMRLAGVCQQATPFTLRAEGLGHFKERVLWIGLRGDLPSLRQLAAQTAGFGEHKEERDFAPHITIGRRVQQRTNGGHLADLLDKHRSASFGEWRAAHLELIRSVPSPSGANYTVLARLPLGNSSAPPLEKQTAPSD